MAGRCDELVSLSVVSCQSPLQSRALPLFAVRVMKLGGSARPLESGALPRYLFVTGRLAEFALRRVLDDLAPRAGFHAEVAVLPISVAALMTPRWVARHLEVAEGVDRVILPGYCQGDLAPVVERARGVPVESGPEDLRDLPRHFGQAGGEPAGYGAYDIEILAEINHAPRLERDELIRQARAISRRKGPT